MGTRQDPITPDPISRRAVVLPAEHGGWSFTLEPALLGLLVSPSLAGFALAGTALAGFLARTPLKLYLNDRRRGRRLPRTTVARNWAALELGLIGALLIAAATTAAGPFWIPLLVASPLFVIELWYDMRSRSRRLTPELAGTVGIASVAAAVALAGGAPQTMALGLWIVAASRAFATVPFVRVQLRRRKHQPASVPASDLAQLGAVLAVVAGATMGDAVSGPGALAVSAMAALHTILVRRPPPPATMLGAQQVVLGLTIVLIAGIGAVAP